MDLNAYIDFKEKSVNIDSIYVVVVEVVVVVVLVVVVVVSCVCWNCSKMENRSILEWLKTAQNKFVTANKTVNNLYFNWFAYYDGFSA